MRPQPVHRHRTFKARLFRLEQRVIRLLGGMK